MLVEELPLRVAIYANVRIEADDLAAPELFALEIGDERFEGSLVP